MGTCYSKNTAATSLDSRPPERKLRDSKRNKKLTSKELSTEKSPVKENGEMCEEVVRVDDSVGRSRSSTPEIISEHFNEKRSRPGVAPSDSGIESIENIEDEAPEIVHPVKENGNHSSNLVHQKLESTHKCFSANCGCGSAPVNGDLLSSLRQAPSISPCKVHGSQPMRNFFAKCNSKYNPKILTFPENSSVKTNEHMSLEDKSSLRSINNMNKSLTMDRSANLASNLFRDENNISIAPLAAFDSIEANLNDSPPNFSQKRQSLLSEILDVTQSLCKCDFYSIEYCNRDHKISDAVLEINNDAFSSETDASKQFDTRSERFSVSPPSHKGESPKGTSANFSTRFSTPYKRESSVPKNVSFVTEEKADSKVLTTPEIATDNHLTLASLVANNRYLSSEMLKSPAEESTKKSAPELMLVNKRKDYHMRSASLGSVGPVIRDSISEAPDYGIEDDLTSVDLDSVSRVTSLSYSSIRQLMESTEDLVSRRYTAQHVIVDGVPCIVIPADSYHQMRMDLATLKQQLISLSSLIQETEVLEQM